MHRRASAAVAAAAFVALAAAGCGGSDQSSAGTTESVISPSSAATSAPSAQASAPSTTAAAGDYSALLIKPGDIGPDVTADGPPNANPGDLPGTGQAFRTADGRAVVISIAVFPDAAAAAALIQPMKDELTAKIDGPQKPVDIGSTGFLAEGPAKKKSMDMSEVVFTQGRALVDLEIDSPTGNPASSEMLLDVARKQAAAVASGLPG
ncbi:hypothetical protein [Mycolicibacterium sarraceniae]|uniref:Lipoprotein LpqN n=1 Tax=Mycolicibacterium sarraceniae TaxID=1534348 RepID=A0A7I7SQL4_9MYCO|nr:hypothetical protein [Mycolicibacterium sarraceniae]BBY59284.1 hypothetical protein MSAR_24200 [Mycolicibacterium sarraceniae]